MIEKVATSLRDTWMVEFIAPGPCTGEPTSFNSLVPVASETSAISHTPGATCVV